MNRFKRIFKEKIKGERLEGLAKVFNINLKTDFRAYDGWIESGIYAQLDVTPQKDSIKLEAYFHSEQVHYPNLPIDYNNPQYREGICFNKIKEISYNKLNEINK